MEYKGMGEKLQRFRDCSVSNNIRASHLQTIQIWLRKLDYVHVSIGRGESPGIVLRSLAMLPMQGLQCTFERYVALDFHTPATN